MTNLWMDCGMVLISWSCIFLSLHLFFFSMVFKKCLIILTKKNKNLNYSVSSYIVAVIYIAYIIIINSPGTNNNKTINPNTENDKFCEADRNMNCRFSGKTTPVNRR